MSSPTANKLSKAGHWIAEEFGLKSLVSAGKDTHILILARAVRMFAYGAAAFVLALYFEALHISDSRIGLFMTLTLLGDVLISLLLTIVADKLGRRNILLLGALMMAFSGVIFASTGRYWLLLLAAIVGVISPSGGEIGPFRAVEESTMAHLVEASKRSDVFAWYVVFAVFGTSAGVLVGGGAVDHFRALDGWTDVDAYRIVFWVYAGLGFLKGVLVLFLSKKCETDKRNESQEPAQIVPEDDETEPLLGNESTQQPIQNGETPRPAEKSSRNPFAHISLKSRWILLRLCALFSIDSMASGMVPFSLINFYMDRKFHLPKTKLSSIMSATWIFSAVGNIFASSISKRIGLVKTMVFTHLPSAIFLALFPVPNSLALTICLLVARASLSSMDQAPRSAFLSAVVLPNERTAVMGIVNVSKTLSQSVGPVITGVLAGHDHFWIAFVVAGSMKAAYDIGLLTFFVNTKLNRNETEQHAGETAANGTGRE
ncbi:MFS general substrate transporter [Mytilinidion resinicola]|uniref:MFS general substrate transporter n=1 Tax=Mytilinidion resinicola TaxID=574789 RepID=A0A6A6YTN9_9PEZI|nr:MFS general substrate transporter [Mytilinidion resinicola]KAF2811889.1 MFS general substrate transporter [Mytilinidion resinicola]